MASVVWDFFEICSEDPSRARCLICLKTYSRGGKRSNSRNYTTSNLLDHLKNTHPDELDGASKEKMDMKANKDAERTGVNKESIYVLQDDERPKKLLKIDPMMSNQNKYTPLSPVQTKLKHLLVEWIFSAGLPYTTIEDESFQAFIQCLNPRFVLPSESHIRNKMMPRIYEGVKAEVKRLITERLNACSVTTDLWSSSAMDSYMSLTVHYIDKESWERKAVVLECMPIPEEHNADNIARRLVKILNEYNVSNKVHVVIRDNGPNVVKVMDLADLKHAGCFLHGLHLIVTNSLKVQRAVDMLIIKIRHIVTTVRHSGKAKQILRMAQEREGLPKRALPISQPTRWSSTYVMLEMFLGQKKAINVACTEIDELSHSGLTPPEWDILVKVTNLLSIFAETTKIYENENSCISEELPEGKCLLKNLRDADGQGIGILKDELIMKVKQYFYGCDKRQHFASIESHEVYTISTLLDPRFKKKGFCERQAAAQAELLLVQLVSEEMLNDNETEHATAEQKEITRRKSSNNSKHYSALESSSEDEFSDTAQPTSETIYQRAKEVVLDYLKEPRIGFESSPLFYWKSVTSKRVELAKLAMKYLSAPISSVASEREFKMAGDLADGNRTGLLPENVQKLLFLKHNLRAVGFNTLKLNINKVKTTTKATRRADSEMTLSSEEEIDISETDTESDELISSSD